MSNKTVRAFKLHSQEQREIAQKDGLDLQKDEYPLKGTESTIKFTQDINDWWDLVNKQYKAEGVTKKTRKNFRQ